MGAVYHAEDNHDIFYGLSYTGLPQFRSELQELGEVKAEEIDVASPNPLGRLIALDLNKVDSIPASACVGIGDNLRRIADRFRPFDRLSAIEAGFEPRMYNEAKTHFPREHVLHLARVADWAVKLQKPLCLD